MNKIKLKKISKNCLLLIDFVNEIVLLENAGHLMTVEKS